MRIHVFLVVIYLFHLVNNLNVFKIKSMYYINTFFLSAQNNPDSNSWPKDRNYLILYSD